MIARSFNIRAFEEAVEDFPDMMPAEIIPDWLSDQRNVMFLEGRDVGLATFERPGFYNVHWFYKDARGRKALNLAREMLGELFDNHDAKVVRGITPADNRAARWACRQLGYTSHGVIEWNGDGEYELFTMTKDDFYKGMTNGS